MKIVSVPCGHAGCDAPQRNRVGIRRLNDQIPVLSGHVGTAGITASSPLGSRVVQRGAEHHLNPGQWQVSKAACSRAIPLILCFFL
jgi:hypothetical protein